MVDAGVRHNARIVAVRVVRPQAAGRAVLHGLLGAGPHVHLGVAGVVLVVHDAEAVVRARPGSDLVVLVHHHLRRGLHNRQSSGRVDKRALVAEQHAAVRRVAVDPAAGRRHAEKEALSRMLGRLAACRMAGAGAHEVALEMVQPVGGPVGHQRLGLPLRPGVLVRGRAEGNIQARVAALFAKGVRVATVVAGAVWPHVAVVVQRPQHRGLLHRE
mmetsp:Transcript_19657/g.57072  ORF Transcript_19657/g.57072 Transcript_19657/m.57072 type:complete len:215 (+) Transcript_19657:261-905(+)